MNEHDRIVLKLVEDALDPLLEFLRDTILEAQAKGDDELVGKVGRIIDGLHRRTQAVYALAGQPPG